MAETIEKPVEKQEKSESKGLRNFKLPAEPAPASTPAPPAKTEEKNVNDPPAAPKNGAPLEEEEVKGGEKKDKRDEKPPILKKKEVKEEEIPEKVEIGDDEADYLSKLDDEDVSHETPEPIVKDGTTHPPKKGKKESTQPTFDQVQVQTWKQKAEAYDAIKDSPVFPFIEEMTKSGKPFDEFMSSAIPPDPKKLSLEDAYKISLADLDLTAEETAEALDKFREKDIIEQKQLVKPVKDRLQQARQERLRAFSPRQAIDPAVHQQMVDGGLRDLSTQLKELGGKIVDGLRITDEVASLIREDVIKNAVMKEDGKGFDIAQSIRNAIRLNDAIDLQRQKDIAALGKKKAYDLLIKQRNRPARNDSASGAIPQAPEDAKAVLAQVKKERWKN